LLWRSFSCAGVASGTADVVDDDFDFHNAVVVGVPAFAGMTREMRE
jgi:hypothetical protein